MRKNAGVISEIIDGLSMKNAKDENRVDEYPKYHPKGWHPK